MRSFHLFSTTVILLLFSGQCFSQRVISPAGGKGTGTTVKLSWTLGEPVSKTVRGTSVILTQGFQQSWRVENQPPVAKAGPDQTVDEGAQVTLDGTGSYDPEGKTITWLWTPPAGITLSSNTAPMPVFTAPAVDGDTPYVFTLVVNDGNAASPPDQAVITVRNTGEQSHFTPVWTGSGYDHMNINVVKASLDGLDLQPGDEIGLFDGTLCVGMGKLTTVIDNLNVLLMKASRDDGTGNGYTPGHPIMYKFWDKSSSKEVSGVTGHYRSDNPAWSVTGLYEPAATAFVELSAKTSITQTIDLRGGWNIFSGNNMPTDRDLLVLFQPLITAKKLIKIQDENGNSLEDFGIFGGWTNNIGDLSLAEGYKIKVSGDCQISLTGIPAIKPFQIPLNPGWNMISYPHTVQADGLAVVQQLIDRKTLIKVQDELGNSIEDFGIFGGWTNGIGNFLPGEGYKVKVTAKEVLTIYESYPKSLSLPLRREATVHFQSAGPGNGVDHMNINLVNIPADELDPGDEIAVFDRDLCINAMVIGSEKSQITNHKSQITNLPIPVTAEDGPDCPGFTEGHPIVLKVWKAVINKEVPVELKVLQGTSTFLKHESTFISLVINAGKIPAGGLYSAPFTARCFPNPFSEGITIELQPGSQAKVTIDVINQEGQMVRQIISGTELEQGTHNFVWDGRNGQGQPVTTGVYYLRISGADKPLNFKVIRY